jgi:kynurenine formamidase
MDKAFDMDNLERTGKVFDVRGIEGRDIGLDDIDSGEVSRGDFVMFHTGTIQRKRYGTKEYFLPHAELPWGLITSLIDKEVSMIGIDAGGLRMPRDHAEVDILASRNICQGNAMEFFLLRFRAIESPHKTTTTPPKTTTPPYGHPS